jgi:hypothetical protein
MRGSSLVMFSLGVLAGVAWRRGRASRPSRQAAERAPIQRWRLEPGHEGSERASVLGYERAAPASPDPAAGQASGAPGHRILNG